MNTEPIKETKDEPDWKQLACDLANEWLWYLPRVKDGTVIDTETGGTSSWKDGVRKIINRIPNVNITAEQVMMPERESKKKKVKS